MVPVVRRSVITVVVVTAAPPITKGAMQPLTRSVAADSTVATTVQRKIVREFMKCPEKKNVL